MHMQKQPSAWTRRPPNVLAYATPMSVRRAARVSCRPRRHYERRTVKLRRVSAGFSGSRTAMVSPLAAFGPKRDPGRLGAKGFPGRILRRRPLIAQVIKRQRSMRDLEQIQQSDDRVER
jgi:hypothetical protein